MTVVHLIGKSAGTICFMNFSEYDFYLHKLIEEAQVIWDSGRSAWTLLSQDVNGTTRWLSPDETQVALLMGEMIHIEENEHSRPIC